MERIELNANQKKILKALKEMKYSTNEHPIPPGDYEDINLLAQERLVEARGTSDKKSFIFVRLNDYGRAYLHSNPKLKNPSIWEDKKYWITTILSLAALGISIMALING